MSKTQIAWRRDICAQINWQVQQQERYIRDHCSFFVFVGPVADYLPPPQVSRSLTPDSVGSVQIGTSDLAYTNGNSFREAA